MHAWPHEQLVNFTNNTWRLRLEFTVAVITSLRSVQFAFFSAIKQLCPIYIEWLFSRKLYASLDIVSLLSKQFAVFESEIVRDFATSVAILNRVQQMCCFAKTSFVKIWRIRLELVGYERTRMTRDFVGGKKTRGLNLGIYGVLQRISDGV